MKPDIIDAPRKGGQAHPRRQFLASIAAAGAGVALSSCGSGHQRADAAEGLAQIAAGRRVDVHSHHTSPGWFKELEAANLVPVARKGWTPAKTIEAMDKSGTAITLLSTGQAGGAFTPDRLKQRGVSEAQAAQNVRGLARESNEYGARMVADYPGRFILMASLTMPDVDSSLRELAYALDTLKAGGVFLPTSHGDKYIGDPAFAPLLAELNRRKATVYTHPTDAACCINIVPNLPPNTIEYGTDTTRMIMSLIVNGVPNKFRDIRWIFSHAGGTLPFLVGRIVSNRFELGDYLKSKAEPDSRLDQLRRFYYDCAQTANPVAMGALKQVVGIEQMVFGSDFPYRTLVDHVKGLSECGVLDAKELEQIYRSNVERIMPSLRSRTT